MFVQGAGNFDERNCGRTVDGATVFDVCGQSIQLAQCTGLFGFFSGVHGVSLSTNMAGGLAVLSGSKTRRASVLLNHSG